MITYEKFRKARICIKSEEYQNKSKTDSKHFTRKRKISFEDIIYFTLNKRGLTLKMEMSNFEEIMQKENKEKATESALCQQRKKVSPQAFKHLNKDYIQNSYRDEEDYRRHKGYIICAIDGTDLEIPDVEEMRKEYGTSKGQEGQRQVARAKGSCLYDVVNNWVITSEIAKYKTSERLLAKNHIEEIIELFEEMGRDVKKEKIIIIFDRGYPSIEMINYLEENGIKYLFRNKKQNFEKEQKKMKEKDEIIEIELSNNRLQNIKDKEMRKRLREKEKIKTRFVKYKLDTGEEEILITNLDKEEFNADEIGELYYKRWKIELAYNVAKNKLGLENFTGQSKIVIEQEFYGQMFMMNIAEDLRKDANAEIEKDKEHGYKYDYKVNMNTLIGILRKQFILILISMNLNKDDESDKAYDDIIEEIRKNLVPIRPNRKNPRKNYKGYNKYKQSYKRNC